MKNPQARPVGKRPKHPVDAIQRLWLSRLRHRRSADWFSRRVQDPKFSSSEPLHYELPERGSQVPCTRSCSASD
jgi:hypothetical protein